MHPTINIAVRAARKAGNQIRKGFERLDAFNVTKKAPHDYVTDIDKIAEDMILDIIQKAFPRDDIIGEESGLTEGRNERTWLVDPLDGTANFVHGIPHVAVSIACLEDGKVDHGVVYDPFRDELFTATRGEGAYLNDKRLKLNNQKIEMKNAMIATGLPFKKRMLMDKSMAQIQNVFSKAHDIRRHGAASLDLAYVAAGRFDGYWEMALKPWDIAAGSLIAKEAGAFVTDLNGGSDYLKTGDIVCAHRSLLNDLLGLIQI